MFFISLKLYSIASKSISKQFESIVEKATWIDVEDGVQTFMYQLNTMSGTNGQAPFISLFMYAASSALNGDKPLCT